MFASFKGIMLVLFSGVLNGSFATPMKRMTRWQWENIWLMWALWALVIVPIVIAWTTVPNLLEVYRLTESDVLLKTFLFGVGWGLGAITFGFGLYMVGLSLGFSIIMGVTAVTGSLIPMLIFNFDKVATSGGMVIILGIIFMVAGVTLCGRAGVIKEKSTANDILGPERLYRFKWGLFVFLASGLLNSLLNLSFVFGIPIAETAKGMMGDSVFVNFKANNAIWVVALLGAYMSNLVYCCVRLLVKGSWRNYTQSQMGIYWLYAFLMGTLWMVGVAFYGAGASCLGKLGATVAWIILMFSAVLIGNLWRVLTGEWANTPRQVHRPMIQGVLLLKISILFMSLENYISE